MCRDRANVSASTDFLERLAQNVPAMADDSCMTTLLVVDDASAIRRAIRRIVEPIGYEVVEAVDGEDALRQCIRHGLPNGILLDIDMPVMDGMSFLRVVRQNRKYDGVRIIMCSANKTDDVVSEALGAGADAYITKPFNESTIKAKLAGVGLSPT